MGHVFVRAAPRAMIEISPEITKSDMFLHHNIDSKPNDSAFLDPFIIHGNLSATLVLCCSLEREVQFE